MQPLELKRNTWILHVKM